MKSRAFRFALHVLFVGIVAAAAYVVWKKSPKEPRQLPRRGLSPNALIPRRVHSSKSRAPTQATSPPVKARTTGSPKSTR